MRRMSRGFTLIELMVVITIAGVMVGIGMPSFKNFVAGQRVKTATGDFSTAAIYARSEAIKRNAEVGLVAAAGGWKNGWSVKAGTVTLSQQAAFPALTMTSAVTEVVYLGSGRLKEQVLVSSLQVAADGASSARCVSFELSGLPKSRLGNC
ncbi:MAG: GspH/FimT family pseudopilin [Burkholderiales bacterium]|nr:GspH/FimT family pseudopilin [Burkholderiales bacterium]